MSIKYYNGLDEVEQHAVLWENGVHIGERFDGEYKIILYQIFSFYIELFYHDEYNLLRRLRSFSHIDSLDPYIKNVDLSEIGYILKVKY